MTARVAIRCRLLHSFIFISLVLFVFLFGLNGVESLVEDQEYLKETKNEENTKFEVSFRLFFSKKE